MTTSAVQDAQTGRWFLTAIALYFAAHIVVRVAFGGALNLDEAEMLLLARDWRWGYGPQLPLYNWVQVASFDLFGVNLTGLTVPKNLVLWIAYAGLFIGLRRVVPVPQAVAGTLSMILLPNVVWEFQRASTHSIALLAATTWTIAAVLAVLAQGRMRDYAALGVVMGLGCLAKANYPMVVLPLLLAAAILRRHVPVPLRLTGVALALLLTAAIVARPALWVVENTRLALASTAKLYAPAPELPALAETFVGLVAGLLLVAVAVGLLAWAGRGRAPLGPRWPGQILLLAGAIGFVVWVAGLVIAGVSSVESRWMVPIMVLLSVGALALVARRAPPRALRRLTVAAAGLCLVTLGGLGWMRTEGEASGGLGFDPLAALADEERPGAVFAEYHVGGNLALLRPDLTVLAPLLQAEPLPPGPVLILAEGPVPDDVTPSFLARGYPAPADAIRLVRGVVTLRYADAPETPFPVHYLLVGP